MQYRFQNWQNKELIILKINEEKLQRYFNETDTNSPLYTIAWNKGGKQTVTIDGVDFDFNPGSVLPIMMSQSFGFQQPADIVLWQFNSAFYCIVNHDPEVGCVGFVFYGPTPTMFIQLDTTCTAIMHNMLANFEEEFLADEELKGEMLRTLLVRLMIQITRLAKKQYAGLEGAYEENFNLIRKFNLLVEIHFRKQHLVRFYAGLLNKSPKTISNTFSLYSKRTPTRIIKDRIITEAKRQLLYTAKSVKEISGDLGFAEVAHFSKFFKNYAAQNPSEIRKAAQQSRLRIDI